MDKPTGTPKKGSDKKLPTGKEVMKRRTPADLRVLSENIMRDCIVFAA